MSYMPKNMHTVSGEKFHVIKTGTTNGAHRPIVEWFIKYGQTEVTSPVECDYLLVFCPVASRVGTDISEALDHVPAGKKAILVVMHHTFNRHHVIAPSSRLVENPNVLTLDCLFHENKLLNCDLNDKMWSEVYRFLGVSQYSLRQIFPRSRVVLLVFVLGVVFVYWEPLCDFFIQIITRCMPQDMQTVMVVLLVIALVAAAVIWKPGYNFFIQMTLGCMPQDTQCVLGKKFFVRVVGTTNGAHRPIVEEFKRGGQTEVTSPGESHYLLVFCPVASRVGTDISEALDHVPAGKKAILVVMHHTFNRHHVIAASSRLVQNPNILTLDCLFHESKLLSCDLNDKMWSDVYRLLGVSQYSLWRTSPRWMKIKYALMGAFTYGLWKSWQYSFAQQTQGNQNESG